LRPGSGFRGSGFRGSGCRGSGFRAGVGLRRAFCAPQLGRVRRRHNAAVAVPSFLPAAAAVAVAVAVVGSFAVSVALASAVGAQGFGEGHDRQLARVQLEVAGPGVAAAPRLGRRRRWARGGGKGEQNGAQKVKARKG
jgi:hypothetical protein